VLRNEFPYQGFFVCQQSSNPANHQLHPRILTNSYHNLLNKMTRFEKVNSLQMQQFFGYPTSHFFVKGLIFMGMELNPREIEERKQT